MRGRYLQQPRSSARISPFRRGLNRGVPAVGRSVRVAPGLEGGPAEQIQERPVSQRRLRVLLVRNPRWRLSRPPQCELGNVRQACGILVTLEKGIKPAAQAM